MDTIRQPTHTKMSGVGVPHQILAHILSFCPNVGMGWAEISRVREVSKGFDLSLKKLFRVACHTIDTLDQSLKSSQVSNEINTNVTLPITLILLKAAKKKHSIYGLRYLLVSMLRNRLEIKNSIIALDFGHHRIHHYHLAYFKEILNLCPNLEILKFRDALTDIELPELQKLRKLICSKTSFKLDCHQAKNLEKIKIKTVNSQVYLPENFKGKPTINNLGKEGKILRWSSEESKFSLYICSILFIILKIFVTLCMITPIALILLLAFLITNHFTKNIRTLRTG